jgi:hypothetical protein
MKKFWIFRTNLRNLEYYHKYKDLQTFKDNCHDFYLLQGIWYLENDVFDEVTVWRLNPKEKQKEIVFDVNGKKFIQRWCDSFKETYNLDPPNITLFRGGFPEYDELTKDQPKQFGISMYLGSGKRVFPQYGGKYKVILLEDERDINKNYQCSPFYKTANPNIFRPLEKQTKKYDICWVANFSQITQKGQEYFISKIQQNSILRKSKIIHCGNQPEVGKKLCKKYAVKNVEFAGWVDRSQLNLLLNQSCCGIVNSNMKDGCPRAMTEILMSGTPLIVRDETRLLKYYKNQNGIFVYNDNNISDKVSEVYNNQTIIKQKIKDLIDTNLSFSAICKQNLNSFYTGSWI